MKILLSIKPEFAEKIMNGEKKYEFRKNIFKNKLVKTVVIYATMPVGKIIGEFDIDDIICDNPDKVWNKTHVHAGVSKDFFDMYFEERKKSFAIKIGEVRQYKLPLDPYVLYEKFTAPQSYSYFQELDVISVPLERVS